MTMALLIAIAIPTFLGFQDTANDKAAQAALITADKTAFLVYLEQRTIPKKAQSRSPSFVPGTLDHVDRLQFLVHRTPDYFG